MPTASEIIAAARSAATLPACERRAMCVNRKEQQRQELARRNKLRTERENLIPPTYCYLPFKDGMKVVSPPETRPTPVAAVLVSSKQNPENLYVAAMVGPVPKGRILTWLGRDHAYMVGTTLCVYARGNDPTTRHAVKHVRIAHAGDWIIKAQDGLRVLSPRKFAAYYQIIALNGEHNLEEAR